MKILNLKYSCVRMSSNCEYTISKWFIHNRNAERTQKIPFVIMTRFLFLFFSENDSVPFFPDRIMIRPVRIH